MEKLQTGPKFRLLLDWSFREGQRAAPVELGADAPIGNEREGSFFWGRNGRYHSVVVVVYKISTVVLYGVRVKLPSKWL